MINKSKKKNNNNYSLMRNKNQNKTMMVSKKIITKNIMIVMIKLSIKLSNQTNKSRTNQFCYLTKDIAKITE